VEVHVVGSGAVHRRLGDGESLEGGVRPDPDPLVERRDAEGRADVPPGAVARGVGDPDVGAGRGEAVAGGLPGGHGHVAGLRARSRRDGQHGPADHLDGDAGTDQRAEQHVAAGPGRGVDPADHASARGAALRATRAAKTPAPKPLSMFTTVTPGAQELSIPSSAATPPNDAPYPTLVGTATSGTPTSPPTTLGSAPSIPATTTRQSEATRSARAASTRCSPETPTSVTTCTPAPYTRAVSAASAATGASEVPADTTVTRPRAVGSGSSVTHRATG